MQPASLRRAWKTHAFLHALSGLTSTPSAMQRSALTFADEQAARESISSTAVSHASRTALPENSSERPTNATSGLQPSEFLRRLSRGCSSSKTSLGCSATCPEGRSLICDGLGTSCLARSCLKRQPSEVHSEGSGCSSWPTAKVGCHGEPGAGERHETVLSIVENWNTPSTEDHKSDGPNAMGRHGTEEMLTSDQRLRNQAALWPTPAGMVTTDASGKLGGEFAKSVEATVAMWRSPATTDVGTPIEKLTAADGSSPQIGHRMYREGPDGERINQTQSLALQIELWNSPAASDHKGSTKPGQRRGQPSEQTEASLTGLQAQPPATNGSESLPSDPTSRRRLNPRFVEHLMGVPNGWTQLASMNSEVWETWLSRSKALLHS